MSTEVAMKCLDPQKLDDWEAAREIQVGLYNASCEAFRETIGGRNLVGIRFYRGGFQVTGFQMESYREALPKGWRQEGGTNNAVPAKRTAEGKAIAKDMQELYLPDCNHPGVPKHLHCEGFSIFPSVTKIGTDWWLTMSKQPYEKDMEQFDSELWRPARLSEFYAAKEAAEVTA